MKSDVFQMDDGISPKNLNIETIVKRLGNFGRTSRCV